MLFGKKYRKYRDKLLLHFKNIENERIIVSCKFSFINYCDNINWPADIDTFFSTFDFDFLMHLHHPP